MSFYDVFAKLSGLFKWWIIVAPWEQAVRVRLGKEDALLGPGPHLRIPGVDRIYSESVRLRTVDLGVQTIATQDGKPVTLSGFIRFRVENLLDVINTLHQPEDTLTDEAMGATAMIIRNSTSAFLEAADVELAATLAVRKVGSGLADMSVSITDFAFVRVYRLIDNDRRWTKGNTFNHGEDNI